jgi:flagellar protein FliL
VLKNKPFRLTLIVSIVFILLAGIAFLSITYLNKSANANQASALSAKDLAATQYTLDKITTNLQGASFVQIGLTLQTDSKDARDELEQRKIQVKDAVNEILHTTTKVDLDKPDGHVKLKKEIMNRVNRFMTKGRVTDVYITEIVVQ